MTEPVEEQEPLPPPPPPPEESDLLTEAAIIVGVAVLLSAVPFPSVPSLAKLLRRNSKHRITYAGATAAARMVTGVPQDEILALSAVQKAMREQNLLRRAQFLLNSAKRLTTQLGERPNLAQVTAAVTKELTYFAAHQAAVKNRVSKAAAIDLVATEVGKPHPVTGKPNQLVGWEATMDHRTSAECREAHGKNFLVTKIPAIGLPGSVHPHCRCKARKPWPTDKMVGGGTLPKPKPKSPKPGGGLPYGMEIS